MRIAVGSDEATHLTASVMDDLRLRGHDIVPIGALVDGGDERWPAVGRQIGQLVASGVCEQGVAFCFTGTGVSIAANKVPGVRAALCRDPQTAAGARRWNDANILVVSLRATTEHQATEILDAWFTEPHPSAEDRDLVDMLESSEIAPVARS